MKHIYTSLIILSIILIPYLTGLSGIITIPKAPPSHTIFLTYIAGLAQLMILAGFILLYVLIYKYLKDM